jgi:gas vesicle protein
MNSGKVLLIVVAGITAGALAGILFAPAKGKKTRKRLVSKSKNYSDLLKEKSTKLLESVAVKFEKVLDEVLFDERKTGHPEEEVLQDSQII